MPVNGRSMMDENRLLTRAARGDVEAQSALVEYALASSARGVPVSEAACGAEIIARMAASHGRSSDRMRLAAVLLIRADMLKADGAASRSYALLVEGITLLDDLANEGVDTAGGALVNLLDGMADEGDEDAADLLNEVVGRVGPKAVAEARAMKKMGAY